MPARLQILMFGSLRFRVGDDVHKHFRTQKCAALLAYTALHPGRPVYREALMELLWPECAPSAGRRNLSTALWSLRQELSDALGGAEVLATRTGMGTDFATQVTDRILDAFAVDHVIAIGIAGGVTGVEIGDVLTPSVVINGDDGTEHVPTAPPGVTPRGRLRTSGTFSVDRGLMDRLAHVGIHAVVMETGAMHLSDGRSRKRHRVQPGERLVGIDARGQRHLGEDRVEGHRGCGMLQATELGDPFRRKQIDARRQ